MSHAMTTKAMAARGLKPAAKIVLFWLADAHNAETDLCCPGINRLADLAEMDRKTVMRHIAALIEAGYISKKARFKEDGKRTSDAYSFHFAQSTKSQNDTPTKSHSVRHQVPKGDRNLGSGTLEDNTHPNGCGADAPPEGFWDFCSRILQRSGISEREAKQRLGKWTASHGRDEVRRAVGEAAQAADPATYVESILKPRTSQAAEIEKFMEERRRVSNAW